MPISVTTTHSPRMPSMAVQMVVLSLRISFAPNTWEMTTEQPIPAPVAKPRKIMVTG